MKRAYLAFAAILISAVVLSGVSLAQIHGVPASITSVGSKTVAPGASITSLGPRGFAGPCNATGCISPNFTPSINFQNHTVEFGRQFNLGAGRGGHHRGGGRGRGGNVGYAGGYVYAYPYPVAVAPDDEVQPGYAQQYDEAEAPAQTVFDRRPQYRAAPNPTPAVDDPRYGDHFLDQRERASASNPVQETHHNMSPVDDEQIPVVIVFKDGHQQEIGNYAIVGDTLYDLSGKLSHKVRLADLNLQETVQQNEKRGVDFNVPASARKG